MTFGVAVTHCHPQFFSAITCNTSALCWPCQPARVRTLRTKLGVSRQRLATSSRSHHSPGVTEYRDLLRTLQRVRIRFFWAFQSSGRVRQLGVGDRLHFFDCSRSILVCFVVYSHLNFFGLEYFPDTTVHNHAYAMFPN